MDFSAGDLIELIRVVIWPFSLIIISFMFGDTIRVFLRNISSAPIKKFSTPWVSVEMAEAATQKLDQSLKDAKDLAFGDDGIIRMDEESIEKDMQKLGLYENKLDTIRLEFRQQYFEQMIEWQLMNRRELTPEVIDELQHRTINKLKSTYPEYFKSET